jgi:hypothetical protein
MLAKAAIAAVRVLKVRLRSAMPLQTPKATDHWLRRPGRENRVTCTDTGCSAPRIVRVETVEDAIVVVIESPVVDCVDLLKGADAAMLGRL